jgi:two-component system response regulator NreC
MTTSILIADDHAVVRLGLRTLLARMPDCAVVGEAVDGLEAIDLVLRLDPDILVLDLMMPKLSGLQVIGEIKRKSVRTRVIVLSIYDHVSYVHESMQRGADAYVLKDSLADDIVQAILAVTAGRSFVSERLSQYLVPDVKPASSDETTGRTEALTSRERGVLALIADGYANKEIADRFGISVRTVESHRAKIMRKLGLHSHASLIHYAMKENFLPLP